MSVASAFSSLQSEKKDIRRDVVTLGCKKHHFCSNKRLRVLLELSQLYLPNVSLRIEARTFGLLVCISNASLKCTAASALHLSTVDVCDYINWLLKSTAGLNSSAEVRRQIMNDHSASLSQPTVATNTNDSSVSLPIKAPKRTTKSLPLGQQKKKRGEKGGKGRDMQRILGTNMN